MGSLFFLTGIFVLFLIDPRTQLSKMRRHIKRVISSCFSQLSTQQGVYSTVSELERGIIFEGREGKEHFT